MFTFRFVLLLLKSHPLEALAFPKGVNRKWEKGNKKTYQLWFVIGKRCSIQCRTHSESNGNHVAIFAAFSV